LVFVILAGMIKNHIKSLVENHLTFTPTYCQSELIDGFCAFFLQDEKDAILLIKGFAGTGKTTMINVIARTLKSLKIKVVLMAPTGRAAKVMSGYTSMAAYTIHKTIYRQQSSTDGLGRFVLDKNMNRDTWFIVDEVSLISNEENETPMFGSGKLLKDLLEYVFSGTNCRLILSGDTAQLPPVGLSISPALEKSFFRKHGFEVMEFILREVIRQAANSGILSCATQIRKYIEEGQASGFIPLKMSNSPDVFRISGEELIESITHCYDTYGLYETIMVTRSNKRANRYNMGIRNSILFRENEIERGDLLIVVKNNYYWSAPDTEPGFIANGDIAEVVSIYGYEEMYGYRFADVCLRFTDYQDVELDCKVFLDTLSIETASFPADRNRQLFEAVAEDYPEIKNKKNRWDKIRENPWFNALQVKYAYALTCHKAQGGQWKAVFVDHGYLVEEMLDQDYYRWIYTAFTRAVEKLFLVNFSDNFFENKEK
jgi:exodeoxyribonuclease V